MSEKLSPKTVQWLRQLRDSGPAPRWARSSVPYRAMRRELTEWATVGQDGSPIAHADARAISLRTGKFPVAKDANGRWLERITDLGRAALAAQEKTG